MAGILMAMLLVGWLGFIAGAGVMAFGLIILGLVLDR